MLISEIYPTKIRGKAMSLATLSVWGSNWLVAVTFLTLLNNAGPAKTFWLYGGVSVVRSFFCYALFPKPRAARLSKLNITGCTLGKRIEGVTVGVRARMIARIKCKG